MSISIIQPITAASHQGGFDIPTLPYTDASGATYKIGSPLSPSGGDLVEATAGSPTASLAGVALQAGSDITASHVANSDNSGVSTPLLMVPALPHIVFEGTFANNGSDVAIAATNLYVKYGLTKDSTSGYWYVDKNKATTDASVVVIGIKNLQDITLGTTTGARVFFTFLAAETIYSPAS